MARRRSTRAIWLFVSLLITTTLAVPAAYVLVPHVQRWRMLNRLTSDDLSQRERGLNYVIRHAPHDETVLSGALERLAVADETNFLHLVNALDQARLWSPRTIPPDAWLRWLKILSRDEHVDVRIKAVQFLADYYDHADHPDVTTLLSHLMNDDDEEVRYNALYATAELLSADLSNASIKTILLGARRDSNEVIASDAILLAACIGEKQSLNDLPDDSLLVQRAALFSQSYPTTGSSSRLADILNDPDADPTIRDFAAYCLSFSDAQSALDQLLKDISSVDVNEENARRVWRAILGAMDNQEQAQAWLDEIAAMPKRSPLIANILLPAVAYRLGHANGVEKPLSPLVRLAIYESPHRPADTVPDSWETDSKLLQLMTWLATDKPDVKALAAVFSSDSSTMRDVACVLAAAHFDNAFNTLLIEHLLNDFNDYAKMSGAILAGLTGLQPELLLKKMRAEDVWVVRQVHRLAVWMQIGQVEDDGKTINMHDAVVGYFSRDDMPASTVLLAMLKRDRARAFDVLFNPRANDLHLSAQSIRLKTTADPITLQQLLVEGRWWHVLRPHLPEDAPELWLWADDQLQTFQLDVLRCWYVTHNHDGSLTEKSEKSTM